MSKRDAEIIERMEREGRITYADAAKLPVGPITRMAMVTANSPEIPVSSIVKIRPHDPFQRMRTKLEKKYARHLEDQKLAGLIDSWAYEWATFLLSDAEGCCIRYTPDFATFHGEQLRFIECKGHWFPDSLLRFRLAKRQIPFDLQAVRMVKGQWEYTEAPKRDEYKGERAKRKAGK